MVLLEVVLFLLFVVPLGYATIQACRVNARRERERRRFNRDQSIRELEAELRIGLTDEPIRPDADPRVVVVAQMPAGARPQSDAEAWKHLQRRSSPR